MTVTFRRRPLPWVSSFAVPADAPLAKTSFAEATWNSVWSRTVAQPLINSAAAALAAKGN